MPPGADLPMAGIGPVETPRARVLGGRDLWLFSISAVLGVGLLPASAAIGPPALTWWVITFLLFFFPYGLVSAELGAAYPEQGGLAVWVRRAFGSRWESRTAWLYWINVPLWMPSQFLLAVGVFAELFAPETTLGTKVAAAIALCWAATVASVLPLRLGKWVPELGAVLKVVIMVLLTAGGLALALRHGPANDLSPAGILPTWDSGLAFLPVIVYSFLGFELMSGASGEMRRPTRDVPRAILAAGAVISTLYLGATAGILAAVPLETLGLVDGLLGTLRAILGRTAAGSTALALLGLAVIFTLVSDIVTWSLGVNRTVAAAADARGLPAVLARRHPRHGTPAGAAISGGAIATVTLLLYAMIARTDEDLFWTVFTFATVVFLLPYLVMFAAFVRLRGIDPERARPYRVPGGRVGVWVAGALGAGFLLQALVLFVWPPGEAFDPGHTLAVLGGLGAVVVAGELLLRRAPARFPDGQWGAGTRRKTAPPE